MLTVLEPNDKSILSSSGETQNQNLFFCSEYLQMQLGREQSKYSSLQDRLKSLEAGIDVTNH